MEQIGFHLPRWKELPQIDLYMDQVLLVMNRALETLEVPDLSVTATMINNYVKMKLTAPAGKKKYTAEHLARFFIICFLKQVLSMAQIAVVLEQLLAEADLPDCYDRFCEELEQCLASSVLPENSVFSPVMTWSVRAVACKLRVEKMLEKTAK